MYTNADDILAALPPEPRVDLMPAIREEFLRSGKTIIVLDDDPTGTQTCYDVVVLTSWSVPLLVEELTKKPSILFILTNSRSMGETNAVKLAVGIGNNLMKAAKESRRDITVISRSDSTLRGHFPAELDAVASALKIPDAVRVMVPAFIEGGRFTIGDVHYILEDGKLVPVADTPFAKDNVFGYTHANLKEWVEEKTRGKVKASEVVSVSIEDIRLGGAEAVAARLSQCAMGKVCIINACSHKDLEIFVMGLLQAEKAGQTFICRTSATFVPMRAGISAGRIYRATNGENSSNGSLTVVGSYVPKTTRQLEHLLSEKKHHAIEIKVEDLLRLTEQAVFADAVAQETNEVLATGMDVVIHTSRRLVTGSDAESNLRINSNVSSFLVTVFKRLNVRPAFIIAKGGITSSDLATKGLGAEKALILGQIIPGVPVWKMDVRTKFPEIIFVVFPGNVGDDGALSAVFKKLKGISPQSMVHSP